MLKYLLLSVLVFQAVNSSTLPANDDGLIEDLIEQVNGIIDKLQAFVTDMTKKFSDFLDTVTGTIKQLINEAKKQLEQQIQKLNKLLEQVGEDIACAIAQKQRVKELNEKSQAGMEECLATVVAANKVTGKIFYDYKNNATELMDELCETFNDCGPRLLCRTLALAEIVKESAKIFVKLPLVSTDVFSGILVNNVAYGTCIDDNNDETAKELVLIEADIYKCIEEQQQA